MDAGTTFWRVSQGRCDGFVGLHDFCTAKAVKKKFGWLRPGAVVVWFKYFSVRKKAKLIALS